MWLNLAVKCKNWRILTLSRIKVNRQFGFQSQRKETKR